MTLPSFIVIGPGKTGTTWLYKCLEAHPQIRLARDTKETFFFNDYYDRGLGWYKKFFEGCEGAKAIGEVSNTYFFSGEAAERIAATIPDVKLISMLRSPIDRLVSSYLFGRRHARNQQSLDETVRLKPRMVKRNFFDEYLDKYLQYFPREQLLVTFYDDIKADPGALLSQIYAFIGVDPNFRPAVMNERVFAASKPRMAVLARALKPLTVWMRKRNLFSLLTWAKLNPVVQGLLNRRIAQEEKPQLSNETREYLRALYRPHIARVEAMTGRDLSHWK